VDGPGPARLEDAPRRIFGGPTGRPAVPVLLVSRFAGERLDEPTMIEPRPEVDLGQLAPELGAVAFDQAADGCDAAAARVRRSRGLEDRVDGLLFGGVDEAARVDDDEVGFGGARTPQAGSQEGALEAARVGLVLRAAQGLDDEAQRVQR